MADRCMICYRPLNADSIDCPTCPCGRRVCKRHGEPTPDAREVLGELIDWFGAPDWTGPQVPEALAKRIADVMAAEPHEGAR